MRLKPSYILIMILRFKSFKNCVKKKKKKPLKLKQSLEKIEEEEIWLFIERRKW